MDYEDIVGMNVPLDIRRAALKQVNRFTCSHWGFEPLLSVVEWYREKGNSESGKRSARLQDVNYKGNDKKRLWYSFQGAADPNQQLFLL